MKKFQSILVIIPPKSPKITLQRLVWNSMLLAQWIQCEAHFLADPIESQTTQTIITEFTRRHKHAPFTLVIHPSTGNATDRVLETIRKYSCSLVVLQDGAILHSIKGIDERRLLELSPSPVLLLPMGFDFRKHPPQSFLVPLSGETKQNEALTVSLQLAVHTSSSVDFLHIMNPGEPCNCARRLESLGDQFHHEYGLRLEHIASEASPYSTVEERSHLRHFLQCTGFTTAEVVKTLSQLPGAILVLEWKGSLATGHAKIIKGILKETFSPILFVKTAHERKSTLRVGKNLRAG